MKRLLLISLLLGIASLMNAMDNDVIFRAIDENDMIAARQLLNEELQRDPNFSVVPWLTVAKTAEMAKMLIDEYGADVNQKFVDGSYLGIITPLHRMRTQEVAKVLLAHNANINVRTSRGGKMTPLNAAYDMGVMEALLEAGADANAQNTTGDTRLMHPALVNNIEQAKLLVSYGADSTIENAFGNSPMKVARRRGNSEIVELFERQQKIRSLLREHNVPNIITLLRNKEMYGSFRNPYEN